MIFRLCSEAPDLEGWQQGADKESPNGKAKKFESEIITFLNQLGGEIVVQCKRIH